MPITQVDRNEIFLLYALVEAARSLAAFDEISRLAAVRIQRSEGIEVREMQSVFDHIRLALHSAANVSRIFWPPSATAKERGNLLSNLVGVKSEHPLNSRTLRNHIEHMDERLDKWTSTTPRPFMHYELVLYDDMPQQTRESILNSVAVVYDQATDVVHILGEPFSLPDIKANVLDIRDRVSSAFSADKY